MKYLKLFESTQKGYVEITPSEYTNNIRNDEWPMYPTEADMHNKPFQIEMIVK